MADNKPKQFEKIKGVGEAKAAQIVAAFELGKRLARFHADRDKITSPADVADLMMSKMRYLQKEIVCVVCLDTKGGVTTKGIAGNLNENLTWGKKLLSEGTVFEGTLNASVFHPREISDSLSRNQRIQLSLFTIIHLEILSRVKRTFGQQNS